MRPICGPEKGRCEENGGYFRKQGSSNLPSRSGKGPNIHFWEFWNPRKQKDETIGALGVQAQISRLFRLYGATDVTRTHDLLITKYTKSAQGATLSTLGHFLFSVKFRSNFFVPLFPPRFFLLWVRMWVKKREGKICYAISKEVCKDFLSNFW